MAQRMHLNTLSDSLRFPQMTGYAKKLNENAAMSYRVSNKQLLKN